MCIWVALQSKTCCVSRVCDWFRDAPGLDFDDRSWICNAAQVTLVCLFLLLYNRPCLNAMALIDKRDLICSKNEVSRSKFSKARAPTRQLQPNALLSTFLGGKNVHRVVLVIYQRLRWWCITGQDCWNMADRSRDLLKLKTHLFLQA